MLLGALPGSATAAGIAYQDTVTPSGSDWRILLIGGGTSPASTRGHVTGLGLSPSGNKLVYSLSMFSDGGYGDVYLKDLGSNTEARIYDRETQGSPFEDARFAADGNSIVGIINGDVYSMSLDGSSFTVLADFPQSLSKPAVSSDGKLAFLATGTPAGDAFPRNSWGAPKQIIYVVEGDLQAPRPLTQLGSSEYTGAMSFSPDGDKIVYPAYNGRGWVNRVTDVASLSTSDVPNAWGTSPEWETTPSSGGRYLLVEQARRLDRVEMSTGRQTLVASPWSAQIIRTPQAAGPAPPRAGVTTDVRLLERYSPELRYHPGETYRADAANEITDNFVRNDQTTYSNALDTDANGTLAWSDPAHDGADLYLDLLGPDYWLPDSEESTPAAATDRVNEDNGNYAVDAQRLHAQPEYANQIYGRVVDEASGERTLQYWMFSYYNSKDYGFGAGLHEGDWEMVQVHLDEAWEPTAAAYAQHHGGEVCGWEHVQKANGHPIAYVADASHATYFSSGYHFNSGADDNTSEDGDHVLPTVNDVTNPPYWMSWPGKWGGSDVSPNGPAQGGNASKWESPRSWADSVDGCTEGQTGAPQARINGARQAKPETFSSDELPALSTVRATRAGDGAAVTYRPAPRIGRRRVASRLLITAPGNGRKVVPLTQRFAVGKGGGTARFSFGLGPRPKELTVRVVSRNGVMSRPQKVPIR